MAEAASEKKDAEAAAADKANTQTGISFVIIFLSMNN